ncbi:phospholipase D-like domain-containing protein [Priestia endophytica]|uniref:phospholipase D-like domain-containing protein n=1 Tax=Priestia endophytica TaxID=135735 RepID=UPI003D28FEF7
MLPEVFLKTMIDTVKYDELYENYNRRTELLTLLRKSMIIYNERFQYTRKPNQRWEDIELRVPVPMLKTARSLYLELKKLAAFVYIETDEFAFRDLDIRPKPIDLDNEEIKEHDVLFDEIKDEIIQGIRNAKYTIWVAVAWFTDRDIFKELLLRKNDGVHIRIITSDEKSNRYLIDELEQNFDVVKVKMRGDYLSNRMHDKFCIVDLEFVIHGSYNWSKNARNNDETLATALDRDLVKKFADEFQRLYIEHS